MQFASVTSFSVPSLFGSSFCLLEGISAFSSFWLLLSGILVSVSLSNDRSCFLFISVSTLFSSDSSSFSLLSSAKNVFVTPAESSSLIIFSCRSLSLSLSSVSSGLGSPLSSSLFSGIAKFIAVSTAHS